MKHYNHPFRTDYTPNGFKKPRNTHPVMDLLGVIAMVAVITYLLGVYGPSLDERASLATQDAQRAARLEMHKSMADAKVCREQAPGSLIRYTADGQLVCVPVPQADHLQLTKE